MSEKYIRNIFYYKNYYLDFYNKLDESTKLKLNWTLKLIATTERVPVKFFRSITNSDGLYEVRVEYSGNIYRIFCFFDKGKLIVLINGFKKKSQKTPKKEIKKAEEIKNEYYDERKR